MRVESCSYLCTLLYGSVSLVRKVTTEFIFKDERKPARVCEMNVNCQAPGGILYLLLALFIFERIKWCQYPKNSAKYSNIIFCMHYYYVKNFKLSLAKIRDNILHTQTFHMKVSRDNFGAVLKSSK